MSQSSLSISQIVNKDGHLSIDVFNQKSQKDPTAKGGHLVLNSNGKGLDALCLNAPHGELHTSSRSLLQEANKSMQLKTKMLTCGNLDEKCVVKVDTDSNQIDMIADKYAHSQASIQSPNIRLDSERTSGIHISQEQAQVYSKGVVQIGERAKRPLLQCDCRNKRVTVDGDLAIRGRLQVDNGITRSTHVEHVVSNKALLFDATNSTTKDWAVASIDSITSEQCGLFYSGDEHRVTLSNSRTGRLGRLSVGPLQVATGTSSKMHSGIVDSQEPLLEVGNKVLQIDANGNVLINGNLRVNGEVKLNNSVHFYKSGEVGWNGQTMRELTQFRVGSGYAFQSIQACIDFVELSQSHLDDGEVCIEVYPSKEYVETVVVKNSNIRLIGKCGGVRVRGSVEIDASESNKRKTRLVLSNITFHIPAYHHFVIQNVHSLSLNEVELFLEDSTSKCECISTFRTDLDRCRLWGKGQCSFETKNGVCYLHTTECTTNIEWHCDHLNISNSYLDLTSSQWKICTQSVSSCSRTRLHVRQPLRLFRQQHSGFVFSNNSPACIFFDVFYTGGTEVQQYFPKLILKK